ncbi:hypothetical protein DCAR_0518470 [Daucus carota subsp. sativus]|uniref:B-block binding subunit of TFIIIC domain-containing protein n=1 Tax=Daucus carota subsp. sativus TaxID=79200 RepID=A0AAF1AZR3_DAUCS|nr:hypothetical protein DCAR_0518470 [Daucus carota subsp. sativus]
MEPVVNSALEEICAVGSKGLTLPQLWPKLHSSLLSNGLPPCGNVKRALWASLLNVPGLHLESPGGVCYNCQDSVIQSVEEAEKLNLKIVAAENLRNCFVGMYDIKASNAGISVQGRRALERIAIARTNGITQSELGKEFGIPGNKIFYVLRKLECQGLIARQSTILRKTEVSSDRGQKNSSIVSTNMVHLYRFAKHLGCQQRLEVLKEDKLAANDAEENAPYASGMVEESVTEDVQVKDFLPELKSICDKLEEADSNVLIVSDLKKDLGYRGHSGHRRWRNILHRLKDACVVEEFTAIVNTKEVICVKLLKKFSPKHFEPKSLKIGLDDPDAEEQVILGKRGQINDQLVELPIEHQVYDMIDAEGSKGLTKTELCRRLGLNNKRYNTRLQTLFSRFGMHLQAESQNKGVAYRVWSHGNFNREALSSFIDKPDVVLNDNETSVPNSGKRFDECSTEYVPLEDDLAKRGDTVIEGENENVSTELEIYKGLPAVELHIVDKAPVSDASISAPNKRKSDPKYLCLTANALSKQREHRILALLQEEKFLIKAELHRHLESLDKDKQTTMDRKTLERSLNKLQREGLCKLIHVGVPAVTNCGRSRTMDIVLHPSLDNITPELLSQIYERVRSFEMQIRNHQSSAKLKKSQKAPILDGVQRILPSAKDDQSERIEAMRENGYVIAKMVRAKLLHIFFWSHLTKLPGWSDALQSGMHGYDQKNPHSTCKMIELDTAIKAMPLELFLQVVGSTIKFENMTEKCRTGMCLSDLSVQEYEHLMGTQETARLSNLVQILRGLKLIRMVSSENLEDAAAVLDTTLTYSLELKPYIEEPVSLAPCSAAFVPSDIRPQYRHDFVLSSRTAVDDYWNTLEYCYAAVDREAALHAFPGSAVHEVYLTRSWASARVMTADQRAELNKSIMKNGPDKKLSLSACEKIAKDLSLTLEQVLRVYYDNRQKRNTRLKEALNQEEIQPLQSKHASSSRKRKRSSNENMKSTEEFGVQEKDFGDQSFISECALSRLRRTHQRKFSWTEIADRQLVIEYVRERMYFDALTLQGPILNKRKRKRGMRNNVSGRLQRKYIKFLNGGADVSKQAFKSLAISNAVELFKLVFLNASTAPEVPTMLAETLRRYSEHDLFAAFNYLRDAKIMVGGSGASPFVLSQKFIHGISSSPYPPNTGKIAAEFRRWLHGKEKNLMEEGIDIPANLRCGDVVYLSALLSSREIVILPCLPDQGVGEAEDLRTAKRKRVDEFYSADKAKKTKHAIIGEGEICSRREKGFPGIRLSLTRATISRVDIIDLFKERDIHSDEFFCGRNEQKLSSHVGSTKTDHLKEIDDLGTAVPLKISVDDTPWEAMARYADNLEYIACNQVRESPFCPQIFRTVYSAIQKAGDQGLSMEEISMVTNIQGDKISEIIVEVLEAFDRALKVNAYDTIHVVDSLYQSKYYLTSLGDPRQYRKVDPSTNSNVILDYQHAILQPDNHENDSTNVLSTSINDDVHRVTVLNLPEEIQPSSEVQKDTETESCQQHSILPETHQVNDMFKFHNEDSYLCRPILSWINGDGTINEVVYNGLVRRVLGILMQNPGMLEVDIIRRMQVLNPQSCRKLLEIMILDNIIIVRKMHQATSCEPPAILGGLIGNSFKKPKSVSREHFFANPLSAATLL